MNQFHRSRKWLFGVYALIFLFIFLCNLLTPYLVDDFVYLYSFDKSNGVQRIDSLWDIFPSMAAHAVSMNGRLVAHTLVQLFGMAPLWVFDAVNALVFTLQVALISGIGEKRNRSVILTVAVFCCIWLFEPGFGQVNLWQDGAINYLWSIVFCLLYLQPHIDGFLNDTPAKTTPRAICFLVFSFLVGAYSETASAAVIFISAVLAAIQRILWKKKINWSVFGSIAAAFLGYLSIYLAPAQWNNKSASLSLSGLAASFLDALYMYESFGVLFIIFAVLLILNLSEKSDRKWVLLALVLLSGSLAANFIMVMADYYPERSAVAACTLLIASNVVLMRPLLESKRYKTLAACALTVLILLTVVPLQDGMREIVYAGLNMHHNETYIYECKEQGIMDIEVPVIPINTKYNPVYGLKYLDTVNRNSWPNGAMARYYGVNSIIGMEANVDVD